MSEEFESWELGIRIEGLKRQRQQSVSASIVKVQSSEFIVQGSGFWVHFNIF